MHGRVTLKSTKMHRVKYSLLSSETEVNLQYEYLVYPYTADTELLQHYRKQRYTWCDFPLLCCVPFMFVDKMETYVTLPLLYPRYIWRTRHRAYRLNSAWHV